MGIGLAIAGAASSLVGAGLQMAGSISAGQAQAAQQKQQAALDRRNAQIAAQNAQNSLAQGDLQAQRDQQQGAMQLAMQRARMAANGIDISSGSALDTQAATGLNTGRNVAADQYNSNVQAVNNRNEATSDIWQGQNADVNAKNARRAGNWSAVGQGIQGIGNAAGSLAGVFGGMGGGGGSATGSSENPFSGSGTKSTGFSSSDFGSSDMLW